MGYLRKGALDPATNAKGFEFSNDGILKVPTELAGPQTFLIQAE